MFIHITSRGIFMNDEAVSEGEMLVRLGRYAEAARIASARPMMVVAAEEGVEGMALVKLFHQLVEREIRWISAAAG
jgi:hypothetical protein